MPDVFVKRERSANRARRVDTDISALGLYQVVARIVIAKIGRRKSHRLDRISQPHGDVRDAAKLRCTVTNALAPSCSATALYLGYAAFSTSYQDL